MRIDKLTSKFQLALSDAQSLAVGQDHQLIEPAHVMVALLDQQGGSVRGLLTKSGVNVNLLRSQLGDAVDRMPKVEGTGGEVHIGNDLTKLFNLTDKLAQERNDQFISSELFVLAAMDEKSPLLSIMQQAGAVKGRPLSRVQLTAVGSRLSSNAKPLPAPFRPVLLLEGTRLHSWPAPAHQDLVEVRRAR